MRRCSFLLSLMFPLCGFFLMILTSCENFLNGGETARQIQEAIEIANSDPTTIYIEAEKDSGIVTPTQVKVKKKESFDLSFNPADDWKFIAWEVLDRTSGEVLDDVIKFDDASKLSVTGTLLKPTENLLIRPKSLRLPSIVSVTPAFPEISYSNAAITVTFNMPMEPEYITQDSSLFRYGPQNISITCGSDDVKEYFEVPEFNTSKTTLTLTPKSSKLSSFIQSLNKPFADIQISFGENIALVKDGVTLTLAQDKRNLFVRYKDDIETTPPSKYEFYVTQSLDSENHFTQAALSTFGESEILQNRTKGTVYIYGRFYDADSGVQSVKLTEKHTNARDGILAPVAYDPEIFTASNADSESGTFFTDDGNGTTTFRIKYDLKSDDGAVLITVSVSDACSNLSDEQSFTAIKDGCMDLSDVELYNFRDSFPSTGRYFTYDGSGNGTRIEYEDWPALVRNVKLNAIKKCVYKDCFVPESSLKEVSLTYNSSVHGMNYDSSHQIWNHVLSGAADIAGLELTLTVEDDFGNRETKKFSFPGVLTLQNIFPTQTAGSYSAYFSSETDFSRIASVYDYRYSKAQNGPAVSQNEMYDGTYPEGRTYSLGSTTSISMRDFLSMAYMYEGHSYYGIYSNYRFFLLNGQLAGFMTDEISISDVKTVDETLPPVVVKEARVDVSTEGDENYLLISGEMDTSSYNPWERYDSIIVQFSSNQSDAGKTIFLEKNSTSFLLTVSLTSRVYNAPVSIKLTGINSTNISGNHDYGQGAKNGWDILCWPFQDPLKFEKIKPDVELSNVLAVQSLSAIYSTESFTVPKRYDYMVPVLVEDYQSGLEKVIVNSNGIIWTYDSDDLLNLGTEHIHYTMDGINYDGGSGWKFPPIWDVDKELNSLIIKYFDGYGNSSEWSGYFITVKIPSFSLKKGTSNTFVSEESDSDLYQWHLGISKFDSGTNTWSKHSELTSAPQESIGTNGGKVYTYSSVGLPSSQFVKVVGTAALEDDVTTRSFGNSAPFYFYTGSSKNSGDYDYILANGSSKSTLLVASDAPTFVHTLVTKHPLSECRDWTVGEWEHNHRHIGDKYMDFSTNPTAKKYTIPVGEMEAGDCYVVIAYFADGTCTMSSVMQK